MPPCHTPRSQELDLFPLPIHWSRWRLTFPGTMGEYSSNVSFDFSRYHFLFPHSPPLLSQIPCSKICLAKLLQTHLHIWFSVKYLIAPSINCDSVCWGYVAYRISLSLLAVKRLNKLNCLCNEQKSQKKRKTYQLSWIVSQRMQCMGKKKKKEYGKSGCLLALHHQLKQSKNKIFLCIVLQQHLQSRTAVSLPRSQMLQVGVCSAIFLSRK